MQKHLFLPVVHLGNKTKKDCSFDPKVVYLIVIQAINIMNNLIQNYEIILKTLQENCSHITSFKQIKTHRYRANPFAW